MERIFDAFTKLGTAMHRMDAINRKKEQINSVTSKTCGNCNHWMKTSKCEPEQKGIKKSMNDCGCDNHTQSHESHQLEVLFREELKAL